MLTCLALGSCMTWVRLSGPMGYMRRSDLGSPTPGLGGFSQDSSGHLFVPARALLRDGLGAEHLTGSLRQMQQRTAGPDDGP